MKTIEPTKLIASVHKPMTPREIRPAGCYCVVVMRRCGVCNRDAGVKEALKKTA